jgi:small-conductance mechanosensitive channel
MLDLSFYGNSVLSWVTAAGGALLAALLLLASRARALQWLSAHAAGPHSHRVAPAQAALEGTQPWFLIIIALFAGAQFLELPSKADRLIEQVALIATIVQAAVWASRAIRHWLALQVAARRETDAAAATSVGVLGFFAQLGLWAIVSLLALENLGFNITTLLAGMGIGGVAVALAAQSILGDVFASITIALDRPFAIGDLLVFDDVMGRVEHIGLKTTRLRSLSGEQIVISNAELLKSRLRNYERLLERRAEFSIGIPRETPAATLAMIPGILRQAIDAQPKARFERAHFKTVAENALVFEAAFFVSDRDYIRYLDTQQAINLAIFAKLQKEGVVPARPIPATVNGSQDNARAREPELVS